MDLLTELCLHVYCSGVALFRKPSAFGYGDHVGTDCHDRAMVWFVSAHEHYSCVSVNAPILERASEALQPRESVI